MCEIDVSGCQLPAWDRGEGPDDVPERQPGRDVRLPGEIERVVEIDEVVVPQRANTARVEIRRTLASQSVLAEGAGRPADTRAADFLGRSGRSFTSRIICGEFVHSHRFAKMHRKS